MNQKSGSGKLVGGIILCVVGAFNALLGFIFGLVGIVFLANPESTDMTVNGETLHGEEAVEAAKSMGTTLAVVGLVFVIIFAVCLFFAIKLFKANKLAKQAAAMQYQNYQYANGQYANPQFQNQAYMNNQYANPQMPGQNQFAGTTQNNMNYQNNQFQNQTYTNNQYPNQYPNQQ